MTIGVSDAVRRKGLGSLLLQRISEILIQRGCRTVTLHVKFGNDSALQFYLHHNFVVEERLHNYYDFSQQIQKQKDMLEQALKRNPDYNEEPLFDFATLSRDAYYLKAQLVPPWWSGWLSWTAFRDWVRRRVIGTTVRWWPLAGSTSTR